MSEPIRILVLEDDPNMLELLCEALENSGYEPRGARGPEQAVELARSVPFTLMISDIRMAGPSDGLGAVKAVKKFQPGIKVVMITGYANEDAPRRAIELEVDDYVYKPFRIPAMLEVIRRVLARRRNLLAPLIQLRKWLAAPLKLMEIGQARKVEHLARLLEKEKQRVFQGFFVAIRSKHLTRSAALDLWDQLENLEKASGRLYQSASEVEIQAVGTGYRRLYERLGHLEKTGKVVTSGPRSPQLVSRSGFNALFDQVQSGEVGLEDLTQLLCARVHAESAAELDERQNSALLSLRAE